MRLSKGSSLRGKKRFIKLLLKNQEWRDYGKAEIHARDGNLIAIHSCVGRPSSSAKPVYAIPQSPQRQTSLQVLSSMISCLRGPVVKVSCLSDATRTYSRVRAAMICVTGKSVYSMPGSADAVSAEFHFVEPNRRKGG